MNRFLGVDSHVRPKNAFVDVLLLLSMSRFRRKVHSLLRQSFLHDSPKDRPNDSSDFLRFISPNANRMIVAIDYLMPRVRHQSSEIIESAHLTLNALR